LIVTSEDCAAPPPHVPDPPSTPTVCTTPPSVGEIPPSGLPPLDPLPLPELDPAPELDEPPEVEPVLEPDEPLEASYGPEIEPLEFGEPPELDALPEPEAAASLWSEVSLAELLLHALAITPKHARHAVRAEWRRTLRVTLALSMAGEIFWGPVLRDFLRSGSAPPNPSFGAAPQ